MDDPKRSILSQVAAGALTPEEAAAQLEELEAAGGGAPSVATATNGPAATGPTSSRPGGTDLARVRVVNQMGSVTVIGDPGVRDVVAEGVHVARREGDTVVIEVDSRPGEGHFHFGRRGITVGEGRRLVVRMNPALALDAEIQAGTLRVHSVSGPIRALVQAGSTVIENFSAPFDVSVAAGSFKAHGRLTGGESRLRCDAGSVKLHLAGGSSVRIRAKTSMGRISLPGGRNTAGGFNDRDEVVIGAGAGSLEIVASMGSVAVSTDQ